MKRKSGKSSLMMHGQLRGLVSKLRRVKTWLDIGFNKNPKLYLAKR